MNINTNIHALNTFDPSRGSYLQVAVDENGVEQLQVVQKNGFEVFFMWLGRLFGCFQNCSTSMKRIAALISNNIETICNNPQATQEGLKRFLDKIIKYDNKHPNEITESAERIALVVLKALEKPLNPSVALEVLDKTLIHTNKEKTNPITEDQLDTLKFFDEVLSTKNPDQDLLRKIYKDYNLALFKNYRAAISKIANINRDSTVLINLIEQLCRVHKTLGRAHCCMTSSDLNEKVKQETLNLEDLAYEIITKQKDQIQIDLILSIKNSNHFKTIMDSICFRWTKAGSPKNIISNFVAQYIKILLEYKYGELYLKAMDMNESGVRKYLQNKDFLSGLQESQRKNLINFVFFTDTFPFNEQEKIDLLITLIRSDADLNNNLFSTFQNRPAKLNSYIDSISNFAMQILICGGLCLDPEHLKENDYRENKSTVIRTPAQRLAFIEGIQAEKQKVADSIFKTIIEECQRPTLSLSPLSAIAITPTKTLMELFLPINSSPIVSKVLILTIMEYYGRGTNGETVTPKCFNQLYADIAIRNNSGAHIEELESDSKTAAL